MRTSPTRSSKRLRSCSCSCRLFLTILSLIASSETRPGMPQQQPPKCSGKTSPFLCSYFRVKNAFSHFISVQYFLFDSYRIVPYHIIPSHIISGECPYSIILLYPLCAMHSWMAGAIWPYSADNTPPAPNLHCRLNWADLSWSADEDHVPRAHITAGQRPKHLHYPGQILGMRYYSTVQYFNKTLHN